jgi:hypothetical protein
MINLSVFMFLSLMCFRLYTFVTGDFGLSGATVWNAVFAVIADACFCVRIVVALIVAIHP